MTVHSLTDEISRKFGWSRDPWIRQATSSVRNLRKSLFEYILTGLLVYRLGCVSVAISIILGNNDLGIKLSLRVTRCENKILTGVFVRGYKMVEERKSEEN